MVVLHLIQTEDAALHSALADAGLPPPGEGRYFVVRHKDARVGYVALEGEGQDQLLRSLVVLPDWRSRGLGVRLLVAAEAVARQRGVERLHLLTTTAERFFACQGFAVADRLTAPAAIRQTRELSQICPASAAYMIKALQ